MMFRTADRVEQALAKLASEFPHVPASFRAAVLTAYLAQRHVTPEQALEAARRRIHDACAM
jgi:hypothetical protein